MSQDQGNLNDILRLIVPLTFILVVNHYFFFFDYFNWIELPNWLEKANFSLYQYIIYYRGAFVILIAVSAYLNVKIIREKNHSFAWLIISLLLIFMFLHGFTAENYYNLYFYPCVFIGMTITTIKSAQFLHNAGDIKAMNFFPKTKATKFSFRLPTDQGDIHLTKPEYGISLEAGAGGGKSVLIQQLLDQGCTNGSAGVLYDYEGDCTEPGGAALTRTIFTSLHKYNSGPRPYGRVGFAYLNFLDPSRTVQVNPIDPKYLDSSIDLAQFAQTLMTNLEPEWLKRKDFWAGNAINYAYGVLQRLYNDKSLHKYMTIPHLAMICTHDYESVFKWILQDKSLERRIMPLYVAYKEEAKSQLAGAVSSAALPISKLLEPEIFYPLSPKSSDEAFNLDITNEQHPVFLSLGTVPKYKHVLGPVCSLILLVCMNNMNRFGKRRSMFVIDELPTLFIPNIDNLPATARKKGVSTILAWQSFKQLEDAYGKDRAEITRDNLSNQFVGKNRNIESSKRIVEYFGKADIIKQNFSTSDSGDSTQFNITREEILQPSQILNQPIGHFTGVLTEGTPPLFHCQFDNYDPKLMDIPYFSKKWFTENNELDDLLMKTEIKENYYRIEREVNELLRPFDLLVEEAKKQKTNHKNEPFN